MHIARVIAWSSIPKLAVNTIRPRIWSRTADRRLRQIEFRERGQRGGVHGINGGNLMAVSVGGGQRCPPFVSMGTNTIGTMPGRATSENRIVVDSDRAARTN
jgi:hypothetical protein